MDKAIRVGSAAKRRQLVPWCRWLRCFLVLWGLAGLVSCAPSMRWRGGRQAAGPPRYADVPFVEVEPVEAPPDEADADDGALHSGPRKRGPVFGDTPARQPEPPPTPITGFQKPPPPMDEIVAGATVQREYPGFQEHHLFPRQRRLREQFEAIGINVDAWTILVDPKRHAEAHGDQATYGPGGHWNHEWRDWFASPVEHSFRSAFAQAWKMINSHRLAPYGLLAPYGCGRTVAHDLYDIVEPPR